MQTRSKAEDSETRNLALVQQFKDLEKQWETFKDSRPRNPRRFSTGSNTSIDQLLGISPRGLMSSLQLTRSPSDGYLKARNRDTAIEEVLIERRTAVTSGTLKGRKLFEGLSEAESDMTYDDGTGSGEICNDWSNTLIQGCQTVVNGNSSGTKSREQGIIDRLPDAVRRSYSFSDSSSFLQEKVMVVHEEKAVVVEVANAEHNRASGGKVKAGSGGSCTVGLACFSFIIFLLTLAIIAMSCTGSVHDNEAILVPT